MFGFRFVKAQPTEYVMQFRDGKAVREGAGLSMAYSRRQFAGRGADRQRQRAFIFEE